MWIKKWDNGIPGCAAAEGSKSLMLPLITVHGMHVAERKASWVNTATTLMLVKETNRRV